MQRLRFSPFLRPIEELGPDDLAILETVAEGWYVEYKSIVPDARAIAKSISSFANQYGGFLFLGIQESADRRAAAFPGILVADLASSEQRIQQAVASHISPVPRYDVLSVKGPSATIGLSAGRAVMIVRIPEGEEAPYVHSSGSIYRRVGEGSEPVPETDRTHLDLLWRRTSRVNRQLRKVLLARPNTSKAETEATFVHVYLLADPTHAGALGTDLPLSDFRRIMRTTEGHLFTMDFENSFPMSGGFIGRHVRDNDPFHLVTTWRYHGGGNSILSAGIPYTSISEDLATVRNFLEGYDNARAFEEILRAQRYSIGWIVDVNNLIALFMMAVQKQAALMAAEKVSGPVFAKIAVDGVWRRLPFLDTGAFVSLIREHGIPLVQDSSFLALPGTERYSLTELPTEPGESELVEGEPEPSPAALIYNRQAALLFALTLLGLGIPHDVALDALDDVVGMVRRSMEVQTRRARPR
jgi:schlafen family protein